MQRYELHNLYVGIVHPKMKILSSFIHPHVVPSLYGFLSSVEHEDILRKKMFCPYNGSQ